MNECDLSQSVTNWLRARGFKVYAEVLDIDLVGVDFEARNAVVVEMKLCLTKHALMQALRRHGGSERWVAVASNPRPASLAIAARYGVGVIRVDGGQCVELLEPRQSEYHETYRDRLVDACRRRAEGGIAGLPTQKGVGPAIAFEARMAEYRAANPKATWKDIFANVPNHYSSAASMRSAFYSNQRIRSARVSRTELRAKQVLAEANAVRNRQWLLSLAASKGGDK